MHESPWAVRHPQLEVWSAPIALWRGTLRRPFHIVLLMGTTQDFSIHLSRWWWTKPNSAPKVHLIKKETKKLCIPNGSLIYCIKNPICPHNGLWRGETEERGGKAFKIMLVERLEPPAFRNCCKAWVIKTEKKDEKINMTIERKEEWDTTVKGGGVASLCVCTLCTHVCKYTCKYVHMCMRECVCVCMCVWVWRLVLGIVFSLSTLYSLRQGLTDVAVLSS